MIHSYNDDYIVIYGREVDIRFRRLIMDWGFPYICVVCLANLTNEILICDLIRLGVIFLQEDSSTSPKSTTLSALRKPHSCYLELR